MKFTDDITSNDEMNTGSGFRHQDPPHSKQNIWQDNRVQLLRPCLVLTVQLRFSNVLEMFHLQPS
jgi:hypothetical protein